MDFNVPIYGKKILDLVWDNFVDTIRMPMLQIVEEIVSKSTVLLLNYDFIYIGPISTILIVASKKSKQTMQGDKVLYQKRMEKYTDAALQGHF